MKRYTVPLSLVAVLLIAACSPFLELVQDMMTEPSTVAAVESAALVEEDDRMHTRINIQIGDRLFSAGLLDTPSSQALVAMLPITIIMTELNRNEKYYYMPSDLPAHPEPGGNIHRGDLMLYGSDCLVLFYESFNTSYSYTRLGSIEDASELASSLGSGNVEITFSLAS